MAFSRDRPRLPPKLPAVSGGMRDRQRAHAELQRKFDIVDDDHEGERLPNQVTRAEYDNVVRTFSDIRLGRSDLRVDAMDHNDPTQFKADAMDDIGDIMQTASGRALISQLSNNKRADATGEVASRVTTITPSFFRKPNGDFTNIPHTGNAYEASLDAAGKDVASQPGAGARLPDGSAGVGSHTAVRINPNQDVAQFNPATNDTNYFRSDVAMFHELTHALHDTRGATDTSTVEASDAAGPSAAGIAADAQFGVSRYEHQAVGLGRHADNPISENVYRRERRLLGNTQQALPGDTLMKDREHYLEPITYNNHFGR
jgi:hypothetical protein